VRTKSRRVYTALRVLLRERGASAAALSGLAELARLLADQLELTPAEAAGWLVTGHPRLAGRQPVEVWLGGRTDQVFDAARTGADGGAP
jgi:hypothetical protein